MTTDAYEMQDPALYKRTIPLGRVRIISDGTPMNTRILNVDGVPIGGVVNIRWELGVRRLARAVVTLEGVEVDVITDAVGTKRVGDLELDG